MTYLDWASTSPPDRAYLQQGLEAALELGGNPSSSHRLGKEARTALEGARDSILRSLAPDGRGLAPGAKSPSLVFTSGGSEADALPLLSLLRRARKGASPVHLVISSIEHSAIHEEAQVLESLGVGLSLVDPGPDGRVDPEAVAAVLRKDTALVAIMAVNNETGAINDLNGIAENVRAASRVLGRRSPPHVHADAVQALGKVDFRPASVGVDSAAFSAHKLRGPRGVGCLWLSAGTVYEPLIVGGGQEGGQRPGTENLQGAIAFAAAVQGAEASREARFAHARALEARLLAGIAAIPGALPLPLGRTAAMSASPRAGDCPSPPGTYSPFILSASFPGLGGEVLARALGDAGVAVSTGAACSANARKKGRRVLAAMGLPEELSFSAIRISTGETTTEADIDLFLEQASGLYRQLKT